MLRRGLLLLLHCCTPYVLQPIKLLLLPHVANA
jgi:hypothetical protein